MVVLIIISLAILVWGFAAGWQIGNDPTAATNALLAWAYVMIGIAIVAVLVPGIIIALSNNPKSIVKILIGIAGVAVLCGIAYALASGAPAMGLTGLEPSAAELKLTDTILNLTYIVGAASIIAIIAGEIRMATKKK